MGRASTALDTVSTAKQGTVVHLGAPGCTTIQARAARGIWPIKTAECWAAAAGVKVRLAKYWLAGREPSDAGKSALARLLLD